MRRRAGSSRRSRPPEPTTRQRALVAMLLGSLSVFAVLGTGSNFHRGVYLVIFAFIVGLTACWFGMTALRQARRAASWRPRAAIFGTVFGAIGAGLSLVLLLAFALFWSQLSTYSQCRNGANTLAGQQACFSQLERSIDGQITRVSPGR